MTNVKVFSKVGQTSRSRSQGKKLWYHVKDLVIRNTHVKYESPTHYGTEVMVNVKVFVHATDAEGYDISFPDIRPGSLKSTWLYRSFLCMASFLYSALTSSISSVDPALVIFTCFIPFTAYSHIDRSFIIPHIHNSMKRLNLIGWPCTCHLHLLHSLYSLQSHRQKFYYTTYP